MDEQYLVALDQYGPNYPKVLRLAAQQKEVAENLEKARKTLIETVEQDYNTSRNRVELLQQNLDAQKAEANDMAEKLVQYQILQHDADSNKQLYDGLLQKLKEAGITAGLKSSNIRVVDPALTPSSPSRPQRARNILLAILVGLVGGVGLALFREYLDNTIKSPDDIEALAGLPSLAVVPSLPGLNGNYSRRAKGDAALQSASGPRVELLSYVQPKSQISEAFRALRTSLLAFAGGSSAAGDSGNERSAARRENDRGGEPGRHPGSIGRSHAADGFRPAKTWRPPRSELDRSGKKWDSVRILRAFPRSTRCSIPIPPSAISKRSRPVRFLRVPPIFFPLTACAKRSRSCGLRFKFIVIDSPPVMAATDAVILSALTDGVLLVVRSGETPKEAFTRTRDLLTAVKSRLLGVVLNAVDSSAPDYYYSYRYYPYAYGYGYGEDVAKTSRFPAKSGRCRTKPRTTEQSCAIS